MVDLHAGCGPARRPGHALGAHVAQQRPQRFGVGLGIERPAGSSVIGRSSSGSHSSNVAGSTS